MLKITSYIILSFTVFCTSIKGKDINIKDFKPLGAKNAPVKFDGSFDNQPLNWKLGYGYKIIKGSGRNGTDALFYERKDARNYMLTSKTVKLVPGSSYNLSYWIKTDNIKNTVKSKVTNYGAVCVEFYKNGKWYGGFYPQTKGNYSDWTRKTVKLTAKSGMTSAKIALYLRKGFIGKIWFDDLSFEPAGRLNASINMLRPVANFIETAPANVKFKVITFLPPKYKNYKPALHLKIMQKNKPEEILLPVNKAGTASYKLTSPANGKLMFDVKLLDLNNHKLLYEKKFTVTVKLNHKRSSGACVIDKNGNALVNNKPFLPIGLFTGNASEAELKQIASAGFNCVLPYGSFSLKAANGNGDSQIGKMKNALDVYHKHGLKVIFSLKDQYPGMQYATHSIDGTQGLMKVSEKVVNSLKNHPALLSWYVCDEIIRAFFPNVEALRRRVNEIDPDHPVYSLTFRLDDFPYFGSTGDILGIDPYPISNEKSVSMKEVSSAMKAANQPGKPIWFVGQIFNWGTVKASSKGKELYNKFRAPTAEEMRSMLLLAAIKGAKGFILYSFHDLQRADKFEKGSFKSRWPQVAKLAGLLKWLEPFILSASKVPELNVKVISGTKSQVNARAFAGKDGKLVVIITGNGPGENKGEITIVCDKELKSKYGKCHKIGKNKYSFHGNNIWSDVLYN